VWNAGGWRGWGVHKRKRGRMQSFFAVYGGKKNLTGKRPRGRNSNEGGMLPQNGVYSNTMLNSRSTGKKNKKDGERLPGSLKKKKERTYESREGSHE